MVLLDFNKQIRYEGFTQEPNHRNGDLYLVYLGCCCSRFAVCRALALAKAGVEASWVSSLTR
jgi:hypothetical protein